MEDPFSSIQKLVVQLLNLTATQRAKFAKKVHKPPLMVNDINFELNGFNEYGSLGVPQTPKSCDALIKIFNFEVCEPFRQS